MISWGLGIAVLVVNIIIMVLAVRARRTEQGGLISFGEAFLVAIITALAAVLIGSIYNYILYNFIDPGLSDFIKERAILKTQSVLESFGSSQDATDKALEKIRADDMRMTPERILMQLLMAALFYMVPSLIIAAILKRKPSLMSPES
jgi:hypothetical protein